MNDITNTQLAQRFLASQVTYQWTDKKQKVYDNMSACVNNGNVWGMARQLEELAELEAIEHYFRHFDAQMHDMDITVSDLEEGALGDDDFVKLVKALERMDDDITEDLLGNRLNHCSTNVMSNAKEEIKREVACRLRSFTHAFITRHGEL